MMTTKRRANPDDVFTLPFGQGEIKMHEMLDAYPNLYSEMDGKLPGQCLLLFYEKNPVNGIYVFADADAENDMADILGIQTRVVTFGEDPSTNLHEKKSNDFYCDPANIERHKQQ